MNWLRLIPAVLLFALSAFAFNRAQHLPASSSESPSNLKRMSAFMLTAGVLELIAVLLS